MILPTMGDGTTVGLSVGPVVLSVDKSVGTAVEDTVGCDVVDSIGNGGAGSFVGASVIMLTIGVGTAVVVMVAEVGAPVGPI